MIYEWCVATYSLFPLKQIKGLTSFQRSDSEKEKNAFNEGNVTNVKGIKVEIRFQNEKKLN